MKDDDGAFDAGALKPIAKLPIFLDLAGRKAVLAGDTAGIAWKAELIAAAGAHVMLCAAHPSDELRALARRGVAAGSLRIEEREWTPDDLKGASIAVADLHTLGEAAAFKAAGVAAGVIVNTVDKGATCDGRDLRLLFRHGGQPLAADDRRDDGRHGADSRAGGAPRHRARRARLAGAVARLGA